MLWKAAKPSEPDDAKWPSDVRPRPAGLAHRVLGDVQGPARRDLRHPRRRPGPAVPAPRERDRAERRRPAAGRFANFWMHNGFLNIDNEKMSKSLGNFFTIRDVLQQLRRRDGALLHAAHALPQPGELQRRRTSTTPAASLRRLYTALDKVDAAGDAGAIDWNEPHAAAFRAAMNDDFNTPIAVVGAVRAGRRGEPRRARPRTRGAAARRWAARSASCSRRPRAFLQAGSGARRGGHRRRDRGAARRQEGAATIAAPTASARALAERGHRPQGLAPPAPPG